MGGVGADRIRARCHWTSATPLRYPASQRRLQTFWRETPQERCAAGSIATDSLRSVGLPGDLPPILAPVAVVPAYADIMQERSHPWRRVASC